MLIRICLLLVLLCFPVLAAPLTQIHITPQPDRLTIELTFGAPFSGRVVERQEGSQLFLMLEGVHAPVPRVFTPASDMISTIRTHPSKEGLTIHITPNRQLKMHAQQTNGGYGLEITLDVYNGATQAPSLIDQIGANRPDFAGSYLYMGLFVSILLLIWVAVKLFTRTDKTSWLLNKAKPDTLEIIWQKPIDVKNRIFRLRYRGSNYLILVGPNAPLLIDRFKETEGGQKDEDPFDQLLRENATRLSDYLGDPPKRVRF